MKEIYFSLVLYNHGIDDILDLLNSIDKFSTIFKKFSGFI